MFFKQINSKVLALHGTISNWVFTQKGNFIFALRCQFGLVFTRTLFFSTNNKKNWVLALNYLMVLVIYIGKPILQNFKYISSIFLLLHNHGVTITLLMGWINENNVKLMEQSIYICTFWSVCGKIKLCMFMFMPWK